MVLSTVLIPMLSHRAFACQCSGLEANPCASLSNYRSVFLGTVESIEDRPITEFLSFAKSQSPFSWLGQYRVFRDEIVVNFSVQETFKGPNSQRIAVRVTKFLGSCGFEYKPGELYFAKGKQYLVYAGSWYAGRWNDHLGTTHCSPTRLAAAATQEIEELRRLRDLPAPRIVGSYHIAQNYGKSFPAFGQKIAFEGNGNRITAEIQRDGRFSISAVPPGAYEITATVPNKYQIKWYEPGFVVRRDNVAVNPKTVQVKADGCNEIAFDAYPDGQISGTVVDAKGKPLSDVTVRLWAANNITDLDNWWSWEGTNSRGEFNETNLSPGKYLIGAYVWSPEQRLQFMKDRKGKPTLWFYPGVSDSTRAIPILLQFAKHRSRVRMRIPATPSSSP